MNFGTNYSPNAACGGRNFGKMRAMEHHASPPSSLIWLWLLVSFGEPLVTFVTALFECWSDHRIKFTVLDAEVVHHSAYLLTTMGGVERFILLLSGLSGRYSVLGHSCHNLGGIVTTARRRWSVKLMLFFSLQSSSCWR